MHINGKPILVLQSTEDKHLLCVRVDINLLGTDYMKTFRFILAFDFEKETYSDTRV